MTEKVNAQLRRKQNAWTRAWQHKGNTKKNNSSPTYCNTDPGMYNARKKILEFRAFLLLPIPSHFPLWSCLAMSKSMTESQTRRDQQNWVCCSKALPQDYTWLTEKKLQMKCNTTYVQNEAIEFVQHCHKSQSDYDLSKFAHPREQIMTKLDSHRLVQRHHCRNSNRALIHGSYCQKQARYTLQRLHPPSKVALAHGSHDASPQMYRIRAQRSE